MTIEFTVTAIIPSSPVAIYDAWLDSEGHSQMTGSPATATSHIGGSFSAWDGYISGTNLELAPGKRIVQSWRATSYKESDPDSRIEVTLQKLDEGTLVSLTHSNVPDDQISHEVGWKTHYFEPMIAFFGSET